MISNGNTSFFGFLSLIAQSNFHRTHEPFFHPPIFHFHRNYLPGRALQSPSRFYHLVLGQLYQYLPMEIRHHPTPLPLEVKEIWKDQKEEGVTWLFEQVSFVNKPDVVFSQFFLKLSESGKGRYEMEIFTINSLFDADKMRKPDGFDGLSPDDLEPLGECVMAGKKADENKFNFATPNSRNCKISDFQGSYHLIDLSVYKEGKIFRKFDGYNDDGDRVLGIKDDRGAIFIKKQPGKR